MPNDTGRRKGDPSHPHYYKKLVANFWHSGLLKNNKWIFVTIGDNKNLYRIHPKRILDIIKRFNSIYEKNGLRLYVVPLNELSRVSP